MFLRPQMRTPVELRTSFFADLRQLIYYENTFALRVSVYEAISIAEQNLVFFSEKPRPPFSHHSHTHHSQWSNTLISSHLRGTVTVQYKAL